MSWLARPLHKLRALFRRTRLDTEMSEEMRHHLELLTEENIAAGMAPEEARYAALRQFGHIEGIKEQVRDQRGFTWLHDLQQDLSYGLRQLRKAPGFTVVAVLTLAIGIGLTTSIFSIVSSVILRPLPFPQAHQLVSVTEYSRIQNRAWWPSAGILHEWRQAASFSSVAIASPVSVNFTGLGRPLRHFGYSVVPGYFETYGITPFLGRSFSTDEAGDRRAQELILNYKVWTTHFGADREILGQTIQLNGWLYTIVGVMPEGFQSEAGGPGFYIPLILSSQYATNFGFRNFRPAVARLKAGVTVEQARSELEIISQRIARSHPDTNKDVGVEIMPLIDHIIVGVRSQLYILLGAVGLLLLIACVNVANLLFARATGRQREVALRTALGASRSRIVRQLLVESILLAVLGGGLGVALSYWSLDALLEFAPVQLPRRDEIQLDGLALGFSCLLTFLTGVGFGLLPALQASRVELSSAIKDGGRGSGAGRQRTRVRHGLVVIQISLALVLLASAGLLGRSFLRLLHTDLGYNPDVVYVSRILLLPDKYPDDTQRRVFVNRVLEQFAAKPDIVAAAFTTSFPHHQSPVTRMVTSALAAAAPDKLPVVNFAAVTPDYFKVIINLPLSGRTFTDRDHENSPPVAIVSETVVKNILAVGNPIGQRIALHLGGPQPEWREIVGVVRDVKLHGPAVSSPPQVYVPFAQVPGVQFMNVVRVREGAPNPTPQVTAAIHSVDPDMPVPAKMVCIAEYVADSIDFQRFAMFLFGVFSTVSLILAALGIYGVMAYTVNQRTNEIGVRMALGAQQRDIMRLILGQAVRLVALGLLIGFVGVLTTSHLIRASLHETSPREPSTLIGIAVLLSTVALLACYLPAQRATKVDPNVALRCE